MSQEFYVVDGKTIFPIVKLKAGRDPNSVMNHRDRDFDITGYCSFAIPEDETARAQLFRGDTGDLPQIQRTKEEYEAQS